MGLFPIVALCALLDNQQPDMEQCVFVEDMRFEYTNVTGCQIQANIMKDDADIRQHAANLLFTQHSYIGPQGYAIWCLPESEMKDFYRHMGVETGDIPEKA